VVERHSHPTNICPLHPRQWAGLTPTLEVAPIIECEDLCQGHVATGGVGEHFPLGGVDLHSAIYVVQRLKGFVTL
jgi:hypothetical protein